MGEFALEPDQKREVFLPKLLAALERKGLSEAAVVLAWKSVMAGAKQPPIKSVEHYQVVWTACDTASDILTTIDDGSDAAVWCRALVRPFRQRSYCRCLCGNIIGSACPLHPQYWDMLSVGYHTRH